MNSKLRFRSGRSQVSIVKAVGLSSAESAIWTVGLRSSKCWASHASPVSGAVEVTRDILCWVP